MAIKVFIDQGHNPTGFHDAGAEAFGLTEQEITFGVGVCLAVFLKNDPRFDVLLSRPTPDTVLGTDSISSIAERVQMANDWPADYFINLQCSYSLYPEANGTQIDVYRDFTRASWLGQNVIREIVETVGTKNNGVRENPYDYTLRYTKMPAIQVKLAYITNLSDAQLLRDDQNKFASAIYVGLLRFLGFA